MDLSVLIPARNEAYLSRTVKDILDNIRGNTEILICLDGEWADPPIEDDPRVTILYHNESVGQRAGTNDLAKLSKGKYLMKIDAHCKVDEGFDVKLIEGFKINGDNIVQLPALYNLHVFNWRCKKCGNVWYQAPTPRFCYMPGESRKKNDACDSTEFEKIMIWDRRISRRSEAYCFDSEPHFQYDGRQMKLAKGDYIETMSIQGSCFVVSRENYFKWNICDEDFGSWGSQGIEVACKAWLSGGRVITNRKTWYAHLFRTQGGDFGFPFPISGTQIDHAKKTARDIFFNNKWDQQVRPIQWLIEKFNYPKDWTPEKVKELCAEWNVELGITKCVICGINYKVKPSKLDKTKCCSWECLNEYKSRRYKGREMNKEWRKKIANSRIGEKHPLWKGDDVGYKALHDWIRRTKGNPTKCEFCGSTNTLNWASKLHKYKRDVNEWISLCKQCHWNYDNLSRSIIYYTDNQLNLRLAKAVQERLKSIGLPITSTSLKPMAFGKNIQVKRERGVLTMFIQILTALENSTADIIFFCEHDVLYHPSHFEFTPPDKEKFYYNENFWKLDQASGKAIHYKSKQVSGIAVYRETAIKHYRKRIEMVEKNGFSMGMGYEPATHHRAERVDDLQSESWMSEFPNVDVRHSNNLSPTRWKKEEFRNQKYTEGWTEGDADTIPGWKRSDFSKFLGK